MVNDTGEGEEWIETDEWEDVQPLKWQNTTNIKEHKQMVDKINELVDHVNAGTPVPIDEVPTKYSQRLVKSGGVYKAIEECAPKFEIDDIPMEESQNLVKSGGVYLVNRQINSKANRALDAVTSADDAPTLNSDHLVKSGGVYNMEYAIETKADRAEATANRAEKAINGADTTPTEDSTNLITSGAVYTSEKVLWDNEKQILSIANRAEETAKKAGTAADNAMTKAVQVETTANVARSTADEAKKAVDQADKKPTKDSSHLVLSGGVYEAIESCSPKLEIDDEPTENSQKLVKSGGVYKADAKIYKYAWDAYYAVDQADKEPIENSENLVKSGGVYKAIKDIPTVEIDVAPQAWSDHVVKSSGIFNADQAIEYKANEALEKLSKVDTYPVRKSPNFITSGAVYDVNESIGAIAQQAAADAEIASGKASKATEYALDALNTCQPVDVTERITMNDATKVEGGASVLGKRLLIINMEVHIDDSCDEVLTLDLLTGVSAPKLVMCFSTDNARMGLIRFYVEGNKLKNQSSLKNMNVSINHIFYLKTPFDPSDEVTRTV